MDVIEEIESILLPHIEAGEYEPELAGNLRILAQKARRSNSDQSEDTQNLVREITKAAEKDPFIFSKELLLALHHYYVQQNSPLMEITLRFLLLRDPNALDLLNGIHCSYTQLRAFFKALIRTGCGKLAEALRGGVPARLRPSVARLREELTHVFLVFDQEQNCLRTKIQPEKKSLRYAAIQLATKLPNLFPATVIAAIADPDEDIRAIALGAVRTLKVSNVQVLYRFMKYGTAELSTTSVELCGYNNLEIPDSILSSAFCFHHNALCWACLRTLITQEVTHNMLHPEKKRFVATLMRHFLTDKTPVPIGMRAQCYVLLSATEPTRDNAKFLLGLNDSENVATLQGVLGFLRDTMDDRFIYEEMQKTVNSLSRDLLLTLAHTCSDPCLMASVALIAVTDGEVAMHASRTLQNYPHVDDFLKSLVRRTNEFRNPSKWSELKWSLLYLVTLLQDEPGVSDYWHLEVVQQFKRGVELHVERNREYIVPCLRFLMKLCDSGICLDTLQLLLRPIIMLLPLEEIRNLKWDLLRHLRGFADPGHQNFMEFAAEFGPLFSPNIVGHSRLHDRARSMAMALGLGEYDLEAARRDNACMEILKVSGKSPADGQVADLRGVRMACLSLPESLEIRKDTVDRLISMVRPIQVIRNAGGLATVCTGWKAPQLRARYPQLAKFGSLPSFENIELERYCIEKIVNWDDEVAKRGIALTFLEELVPCISDTLFLNIQPFLFKTAVTHSAIKEQALEIIAAMFFKASPGIQDQLLRQLLESIPSSYASLLELAKECGDLRLIYLFFDPKRDHPPCNHFRTLFPHVYDSIPEVRQALMKAYHPVVPLDMVVSFLDSIKSDLTEALSAQNFTGRSLALQSYVQLLEADVVQPSCALWKLAKNLADNELQAGMRLGLALCTEPPYSNDIVNYLFTIGESFIPAARALLRLAVEVRHVGKHGDRLLEWIIDYVAVKEIPLEYHHGRTLEGVEGDETDSERFAILIAAGRGLIAHRKVKDVWNTLARASRTETNRRSARAIAEFVSAAVRSRNTPERLIESFSQTLSQYLISQVFDHLSNNEAFVEALGEATACMPERLLLQYANRIRQELTKANTVFTVASSIHYFNVDAYQLVKYRLDPVIAVCYFYDSQLSDGLYVTGSCFHNEDCLSYARTLLAGARSPFVRDAAEKVIEAFSGPEPKPLR